ncbi:MAG: nucleotidyltransferase domain-containing protein [Sedimenticolaceae bacterium]
MDGDTIVETLRASFAAAAPSVVCAYLFGSVARGEQGRSSDVDVAVLFDPAPPATLLGPVSRLKGELEDALSRDIDLVVLNHAAPDLIHRVLRDGVLVCERNPSKRVQFEVKARNDYFDLKPYLDEYRNGGAL